MLSGQETLPAFIKQACPGKVLQTDMVLRNVTTLSKAESE
jgi:hypothetical protein